MLMDRKGEDCLNKLNFGYKVFITNLVVQFKD